MSKLNIYRRRIWFCDRVKILAISRSIKMFNWHETLGQISCPDQQVVQGLNEILLNIFSNFIPNSHITVKPLQAPWIKQSIKYFLRKKNRAYRFAHISFIRNGQPGERLEGILGMISQGNS